MKEKIKENKDRKVTVRLSQNEYAQFSQEATNSNKSMSKFIIESCKKTKIMTVSNAAQISTCLCRLETAVNELEYENINLKGIRREMEVIWRYLN